MSEPAFTPEQVEQLRRHRQGGLRSLDGIVCGRHIFAGAEMSYTQEDADRAAEVMRAASLSCAELAEALRKAGMGAATAGIAFAALQSAAAREMARIEREVREEGGEK